MYRYISADVYPGDEFIYNMPVLTEAQAIEQGYTIIKTAEEFISQLSANPSGRFILMNDITIDNIVNNPVIEEFSGELYGNGNKIIYRIRMTGDEPTTGYIGLFGELSRAKVENLAIDARLEVVGGGTTTGPRDNRYVGFGGLAGSAASSTLANISVKTNIVINNLNSMYDPSIERVGGLVGYSYGNTIDGCNARLHAGGSASSHTFGIGVIGAIAGRAYYEDVQNSAGLLEVESLAISITREFLFNQLFGYVDG